MTEPMTPASTRHPSSRDAIGARITLLRTRAGYTGDEMAQVARRDGSAVSQWETGLTRPDLESALRLCEHFGVTLDWLYRGDAKTLSPGAYSALYSPAEPGRYFPPPPRRIVPPSPTKRPRGRPRKPR